MRREERGEEIGPVAAVRLRRGALRAALLALLWWLLTEGSRSSWIIGAPAVAAATWVSLFLLPEHHWRWRWIGLARFLPFFLRQSVRGGIDVARRALHPDMPLAPGWIDYRLRLPDPTARLFFSNIVTLLPGTLNAEMEEEGRRMTIHLLDEGLPNRESLQALERRVADLFGLKLSVSDSQGEAA